MYDVVTKQHVLITNQVANSNGTVRPLEGLVLSHDISERRLVIAPKYRVVIPENLQMISSVDTEAEWFAVFHQCIGECYTVKLRKYKV